MSARTAKRWRAGAAAPGPEERARLAAALGDEVSKLREGLRAVVRHGRPVSAVVLGNRPGGRRGAVRPGLLALAAAARHPFPPGLDRPRELTHALELFLGGATPEGARLPPEALEALRAALPTALVEYGAPEWRRPGALDPVARFHARLAAAAPPPGGETEVSAVLAPTRDGGVLGPITPPTRVGATVGGHPPSLGLWDPPAALRGLLEAQGLGVREAARLVGVGHGTMSNALAGKRPLSPEALARLEGLSAGRPSARPPAATTPPPAPSAKGSGAAA